MTALIQQNCKAVSNIEAAINDEQIQTYLDELKQSWQHDKVTASIHREFHFKNYYQTIAFVNAAAWIIHQQDHHPDMLVSYNHCKLTFTTHSINALSLNDFICAAKINEITEN